jgi:hypothetical protein
MFCVITADAQDAGFQFALTPEAQVHSENTTIHGLSLNFVGQNEQHGGTLGIGNIMTGQSYGFSLGLVNKADSYSGVQFGLVNVTSENYSGWMAGVVNSVGDNFTGFQLGGINYAKTSHGLQLGAINYADNLDGLQIGAINIATKNTWYGDLPHQPAPFFPIVNWSF